MTALTTRKIPLCIPDIDPSETDLMLDAALSGWLAHGPYNQRFEADFARRLGVEYALSLNSCTAALFLAIQAQGIRGEVIMPSFTFVASANATLTAGAIPVFADVDYHTCNIAPDAIEAAITPRTEAIMPVHYGGQPCAMDRIAAIAAKHGLALIEDSAEMRSASGSLWRSSTGYVNDPNVNQGSLKTAGVDVKVSYRLSMSSMGSLLFALDGSYLENLITQPIPGGGGWDCKGLFGPTCGGGNPAWRHVFNTTWSTPWSGLDMTLRWRYFGAVSSESATTNPYLQKAAYLPLSNIAAYSWFDLSGSFNVTKGLRMQLGINNILDKSPPIVTGVDCSTSSPAGANCNGNTFPGVYDAMGRYISTNLQAQSEERSC